MGAKSDVPFGTVHERFTTAPPGGVPPAKKMPPRNHTRPVWPIEQSTLPVVSRGWVTADPVCTGVWYAHCHHCADHWASLRPPIRAVGGRTPVCPPPAVAGAANVISTVRATAAAATAAGTFFMLPPWDMTPLCPGDSGCRAGPLKRT